MAAPYIGNNDFRGYLNYLGSQGDTAAKNYLNFVGGDYAGGDTGVNHEALAQAIQGGFNPGKKAIVSYYKDWQALNPNPPASPLYPPSVLTSGYTPPARAANFDVSGAYNSAYNEAAATQNPLYDKYLNQFLESQNIAKKAQQHIFDETTSNLDTALKNTQDANAIAQKRTGEDVANAEQQIATNADQFQTDSGQQFANDRLQQASDLSKAGLTGGIGAQKTEAVQAARNTQESRQGAAFDQQKQAQELVKARTFEDLARSNKLAGESTAKGKANAQFNLDNWIETAKNQEDQYRLKADEDRKAAILEERNRIANEKFQSFLSGLSDPVRIATASKYNGSF